jgi:hypothetical protein
MFGTKEEERKEVEFLVDVRPGDVVFLKCHRRFTEETIHSMRQQLETAADGSGVKFVFLDPDTTIEMVMRSEIQETVYEEEDQETVKGHL